MFDVEHTIHDSDQLKHIILPERFPDSRLTPRLPQELTDLIIGHLTPDDTDTLAACALVGRNFLSSSRALLFHTITLTTPGVKFHQLVASPYCSLASRVRCLQLVMNRPRFMDLSSLLAFLRSVSSLSIDTVCQGLAIHIPILRPSPALALITVIKLRGTRFQSFNNLATFLCSFPTLQTITLMCLTWEGVLPQNSNLTLAKSLDTIHIFSNSGSIFEWILSTPSPLSRLTTLIVGDVSGNDALTLYKFITVTGITLRHLSVGFQSDEQEAEDLICTHPDLERIPQLRITRRRGISIMKV
ncbi:hypothetical protein BDZ94DRAFT_877759 [Collybia nuda]|uniref:F-box domain-containing protein n=1 Tax=Collybia nuda TaxID=64659 RepID=A0A9P5XZW4_9AGAR|nr:hypothetical protein BDZ94DRAFT_877759 [Collybia nuda]